jgi:hypothetical protein
MECKLNNKKKELKLSMKQALETLGVERLQGSFIF